MQKIEKTSPELFLKILRFSLRRVKDGKRALLIWIHTNHFMNMICPINLSVGKHIILEIATGGKRFIEKGMPGIANYAQHYH